MNNKMDIVIREVNDGDIPGLKSVLDSSGLFPSAYLDDMISPYLNNRETEEMWFCAVMDGQAVGLGYCVPEKLTDGTYNLLAIATIKELQGKGIGGQMMAFIERKLKAMNKRILVVDTSSDEQYAQTRAFYTKLGYSQEARIRDFWKEGEDKIVFWKKL